MLTEAEKKWLRNRKFETCENCKTHRLFCDRCNHIHHGNVWAWDRFTLSGLNVETTYEELKDAAEFEARVAHKLLFIDTTHGCKAVFTSECPIVDDGGCSLFCRLKLARLFVEEEMEKE